MKKYLVYWSIFIVVFGAIFVWWWTQPANYIERLTTLRVTAEETLFAKTDDSAKVYLLKIATADVKKIIEGCEFHGGEFATADQTGATRFINEADFTSHGLFKSSRIGCFIKGDDGKDAWEVFVKDNLLYFQRNYSS